MCEVEIKLNTIDDVKNLVSDVTGFECDFEIISGRFVVDAKSIMGIFILDQVHIFNILSDLPDIRRSQALAFLLRC